MDEARVREGRMTAEQSSQREGQDSTVVLLSSRGRRLDWKREERQEWKQPEPR